MKDDYYNKVKMTFEEYKNDKVESKHKREVIMDSNETWNTIVDEFQNFLVNECGYTYLDDIVFSKVINKARRKKKEKDAKNGIFTRAI